jgi:hypothetical protein
MDASIDFVMKTLSCEIADSGAAVSSTASSNLYASDSGMDPARATDQAPELSRKRLK